MGFGRGLSLWALMLMICCIQQKASGIESPEPVTIIPPPTTTPVITSFNPAHNGRVCSTWGNFYYKTFDGDIYHFPGACNYVFASHCNAAFEDFNIQIRHTSGERTIYQITTTLDGVYIEMDMDGISVNNERVQLPYSESGFSIETTGSYTVLTAKQHLQLMWNQKDNLMLELDAKYANQTCGLCGDFNGIPTYNEFYSNNAKITPLQFANMQKMNGPTEDCEDPTSALLTNCANVSTVCQDILMGPAFSDCNDLVGVNEYIESCGQDLCFCDQNTAFSCLCDTFAEYSRQCAHAGGHPQNWRTPDLCPMTCPFNKQYQECGSPCADTCTNPERSQLCEDHCLDGCFCPPGTVYDDINNSGCVPIQECSCVYNGKTYAPGTTYSDHCRSCSCSGGQWSCTEIPCPGICSVEGGSHISTYDEKRYNVHGDCSYVLSKVCDKETFTVLGELRKCGLTDTETCLKMVALSINGGLTTIVVKPGGAVFVNWIYTQLPISTANVTIFRPSSFFILMHTNFGLQMEIQLTPIMQLFVRLDPSFRGKTCGLCGNFDSQQMDDFRAISGVVEGTAPAFANTWKTQAVCPNIKQSFEDPCSLSIENEKYAHHWCGLLTDSEGAFGKCHPSVNPAVYYQNCLFDTCNCERSEDCMCAALSSYVRACAAKGVELPGWRTEVCAKYMSSCPKSLNYSYTISSCQPTCRSLSEPDVTCNINFVPVDGCTCTEGTYMDDSGKCVPANKCPCYYRGTPVVPGEVLHDTGVVCTCAQGKLNCIGDDDLKPVCAAPMVYFDCKNATTGSTGAECQKSCQTLDMQCYSTQCMSGCMCPTGLVSDGKGNCIAMEECPCIHNDVAYNPGEKIKVDCNTCVCENRMWKCTKDKCLGTCAVYGDGHYITFDDKRYNFNGKCEYTLVQDHCGQNNTQGTFRIITENIPCGSTGTTCSKSIKVFLENFELILSEEQSKVITRGSGGGELPYRIRSMGIYLVIETINGINLLWDRKTSMFIKMSPDFKGQVCGLCGNYDGNGNNDFTTRSQSIVGDVLEFGNSWKVSPTCPDAKCIKDPCSKNPYRRSWSQKQCSIINSKVFAACHSQVEPTKYYEACVTDACACDTGGDCECFCTAVAAYAQACSEFGVCVSWRTPSVCPMFCDYYNAERECDWHYKPCGAPCMKTCRNPSGRCLYHLPGLEGCYPHCPADKPYFNEEEMKCVDQCGCYDAEDNYYPPGTHFDLRDTCQSCMCTSEGIMCNYDDQACYCHYEGKEYIYKEVIYNTTDGLGWCMIATCDVNGTIHRDNYQCVGTTTQPPFTFTTIPSTSGAELTKPATTTCVRKQCEWSEWYDFNYPKNGKDNGDYERPDDIRAKGHNLCKYPDEVECRAEQFPNEKVENLNQKIQCSKNTGLICNNKDQMPPICYNYEIRFLCCIYIPCETSSTTTPSVPISTTSKVSELTPTTCQPKCVWTAWFDVSNPLNTGRDMETPENIRQSGKEVCDNPKDIECRAEDYHGVPISRFQQNVVCNTKDGLQCIDSEQKGKLKKCLNYGVRFLCCDDAHCRPETTTETTTTAVSTRTPASTPGTTPGRTSAPPSSSTGSTAPPTVRPSTQGTTPVATSPGKETTTSLSTPLSTSKATSPGTVSTVSVTSATVSTATATSLQSTPVSKPTASISTEGTTPHVSSTAVGTTTVVPPLGTTTSLATKVISTVCQPKCVWTAWFDVSNPLNTGSDMETPEKIRLSGKELCDNPKDIECRAEDYHGVPISRFQQNVVCNTKDGLQCMDSEQKGKLKKCLNYGVRFLCCDDAHCRPETTTGTTTTAVYTRTPASTPGTTPGRTSAPPSSSTGSTAPPTVRPSTQGTTPVATSPGKETTTSLSTPLSTSKATSPGSVSTISVTSATVSTATATSLQSTPVSKPTASISTEGTTPHVSSTAVGTTTVVPPLGTTTSLATKVISTVCQPKCVWTAWFDVSNPLNTGSDMETPEKIRLSGKELCDNPKDIECRAEDYHGVPISRFQQNVVCNTKDGLQCMDSEQKGKLKKCLNYGVRFLCCDDAHCRPEKTTGTTTTAVSTRTPASTPGTTPGRTSAPPSSSTGSTAPPTVRPSTQGTTPVATSPGKETTTSLSTPLSTSKATSPGSVSTISVTSATVSTATATSLQSTPVSKPTASISTEGTTPHVSSTAVGTTTVVPPLGTTTSLATKVISTVCQPKCVWTAWFDVSNPLYTGSDMETPENIRLSGKELCDNPKDIECRAEDYHDVPISRFQQNVVCNTKDGLQCMDSEQKGKLKKCMNYGVRFLCCDDAHCRPETTPGATTTAVSTRTPARTPGTTPGRTSAPPSSSTGSTAPPTVRPSTQGTTPVATSPGKETTTSLSTPLSTSKATSPGSVSTISVTSATVSTATATSLQSTPVSKPTASISTEGTTSHVSSTAVGTTTVVPPLGTTTSLATKVISTVCQPKCVWTAWFDVSNPLYTGSDMETPENIRLSGKELCDNPKDIECRAEDYHDVPISRFQQNVVCNTKDGLQCMDSEQKGKLKKCMNYGVRFLCCDDAHCRPETTPGATTTAVSTRTPASTPGTTPGRTSAPPSSSTGSTAPPTVRPSTQGTTPVATSPGKETTTSLSTPLSTSKATSPGSVSTISVTSATVSTATATSLQSTPVSKPTASISTEGTTPHVSSTAVGTTTVVPPLGTTTSLATKVISTVCQPKCVWTAWFDVSNPLYTGSDMETPENIRLSGKELCDNPKDIECRAEDYHDVPISRFQQNVVCNTKDGLQCMDSEQKGKLKKCMNYGVRFLCCDDAHCRPETTPGATTSAVSTRMPASTPGTTPGRTSAPPSSSTGSTAPPTVRPSTQGTTPVATSSGKETTTSLSTPLSTSKATSPGSVSTISVTSATVSTATATSLQSTPVSKPTASISTEGTTPHVSSTPAGTTTVVPPLGTTTSLATKVISTVCQPKCVWTAWFDVSNPLYTGSDMETPENIRLSGKELCDNPKDIECRAEDYHDVPISRFQQNVVCNTKDGLQCMDSEQKGKLKKCMNYGVRFLCCDDAHCRPETTPGATTTAVSTRTPASTPGTTPGRTSAPPSSSTGSTAPPTVRPSTQGTTPVATSPGKETTTSLSTPLSTSKATSPGSVSTISVTSATVSTATATSLQSTPVSKTTASISTEGTTPHVSSTAVGTTTVVPPLGTTTSLATKVISTVCQPKCVWTAWFDVSNPLYTGSDMETPENIRLSGKELCDNPKDIECRAEDYHDVPISRFQQNVVCNTKDGLQCMDSEQKGKLKKCMNYGVRFLCCDDAHCRPETTPGATTTAVSTRMPASTPGTTPGRTSAPPSSSTGSTAPPTVRPSTQGTTPVATSSGKKTTTSLSTPLSTSKATSPGSVSTILVTSATVSTATATSLQSTPVSKPTASISTEGTTPHVSSSAVGTTTVVPPLGTKTSLATKVITTVCQPKCVWTAWFDVSNPLYTGSDMETPENIRLSGKELCDNPKDIECRAEDYHDVPISRFQQNVVCNTKDGLQCMDSEQKGKLKKCMNYGVRFLCCDDAHCRPETTPGATTTAVSTRTPASTPGTTPGRTSAPPSSSTGSTAPPTVRPSTQGTTPVATSPGKETTTSLSTPLSTSKAISPGSVSTISVTSATVSTATATSLQSTPVSKPTASISTEGTTPHVSSTAVGTTTVVPPLGTTTSLATKVISTVCQPKCVWTAWFDVSNPLNTGRDMETPENIRLSGKELCDNPKDIECRAEDYHDVPISRFQQNVVCNTKDGLQCMDSEQKGKLKKCMNYGVRFLCCDDAHCRPETTPGATTTAVSTRTPASTPGTTPGRTSAPPSSSTGSMAPPTVRPSTQGTTPVATSPGKETTTSLSTPLSTSKATPPGSVSTVSVTSATLSTAAATSLQSTPVSKPTASISTEGTTPHVSSTAVGTTTVVPPLGTTSSLATKVISTVCQPKCVWTAWFDVSNPLNTGTDMETPENIRLSGKELCDNPKDIECRAEDYHGVPISRFQQNVVCNTKDGLQCMDSEQKGKLKKCMNYGVRFLCCDDAHCRPETTPGATTTAVSTRTPASTPGTTPGRTSAPPSSSTGSTAPPTVRPSTQGTTPVATSPGKETTTSLSTPLSTSKATPPGSVSTVSVTSATVSTATATSLQSTPISKPTASISTEGTTPHVSSTALGTTTVVPPLGTTTSLATKMISTVCQPKCVWTAWFDVSNPLNTGSDMETPENIRLSGKELCDNPKDIECRAEDYHDVPISRFKQNVVCNTKDGLQCMDSEQKGKLNKCLNYQVRFYCCDNAHCLPETTPRATTTAVSTHTPASTPRTTPGRTSIPPSSSSGSTAPPTVRPSSPAYTVSTEILTSSSSLFSTSTGISVPTLTSVAVHTASTPPASSTKTATASSTLTPSRTTPCFCHVSGATGGLFSPGEVIYNKTDSSGCSFYAICDNNCEVKRFQEPCPSPTPSRPPTPSVTTVGTSSAPLATTPTILIPSTVERTSSAPPTGPVVNPTTPVQGCPNADPPRKTNETWVFNNCSMATCEGNNKIVVMLPQPVDKIACVNGLPPVKINHDDGCTYHYDCTCVCSGWDNSHYETFDGTNYTFHDNCTYVLVQEIVKKHGNFSVLVDNNYCDPANNQSCSRSIIINYNHVEVILSSQMYNGMRTNKVIFNKETVRASFSKDGIIVADTGTTMSVEILDIHAFINFNGFTFSVQVPFDLFAFNTEGQCGTCSNDRSDDCRLPSGHKVSSCSEMAPHWKLSDSCKEAIPTPEPTGPTPTPSEMPCTTPSPLCELIVSDIFAGCHKVLPPQIFYEHCLSEACQNANDSLSCNRVEMYASLCIDKGVCTDWRSKTQGKCPYYCPKGKVYEACGPLYPATCDNGKMNDITKRVAEGCFCPADQILVNSYSNTCVPDCNFCVGPDGLPKLPGTKWRSNCQECICDPLSVTVQCKEQPCLTPATPACEKEGFMPVSVLTPEDPCCPEIQCICNTSACSNRKKSCEAGYQLVSVLFEGDCCVSFTCEPMPDICLVNGTVYTPGASIPSHDCEMCVCGNETDPSSKTNLVECEPIPCDTACSVGYEYQVKDGECCGTCVQVTCTINIDGTTQILKPGDIWQPEGNNCSHYECEKEDDQLVLVSTRRTCPIFDPKECDPNETEMTPDGCCKVCKVQTNCKVRKNPILIRQNECVSSELVELTYCEGTCPSSSMYSTEAKAMQHKCTCCQELKSHKKEVSLTCQDGRTINYDYIYVDECQCMTACIPEATTSR